MKTKKTFIALSDLGKNEKELISKLQKEFEDINIDSIYIKDIDCIITRESAKVWSKIMSYFNNRMGRPKISYPGNWQENYNLYKRGLINSNTFMDRVGLKKTTFYKLLRNYENIIK